MSLQAVKAIADLTGANTSALVASTKGHRKALRFKNTGLAGNANTILGANSPDTAPSGYVTVQTFNVLAATNVLLEFETAVPYLALHVVTGVVATEIELAEFND